MYKRKGDPLGEGLFENMSSSNELIQDKEWIPLDNRDTH